MRTQIISRISGCFLSILSVGSSFAQEDVFKELAPITVTASSSTVSVNTRINKAFVQAFKNTSQLKWYEKDKRFLAKFIQNDQNNSALFAKNGTLIYHIAYGSEKNLPAEVRKLIKSTYFDYNISSAIRVNQDSRLIWVVNLEDNKNLIFVRVEDGEMEETKRFVKSL